MQTLKSWIASIILGLISSAIFTFIIAPDQQVQLGSFSLGILAIPLFFLLGSAALSLYGMYLIVHIIEIIAVKIGIISDFDMDL